MKKLYCLISILIISQSLYSQIIKIQSGISMTTINYSLTLEESTMHEGYGNYIIGYSSHLGIEFLQKKYFNLYSGIGFLRKGGREKDIGKEADVKLDYFTIIFGSDVKLPNSSGITPFISTSLRIDNLLNKKEYEHLVDWSSTNMTSFGMLIGTGIRKKLDKVQIGARFDYYLNFHELIDYIDYQEPDYIPDGQSPTPTTHITDRTFTFNITLGYIL